MYLSYMHIHLTILTCRHNYTVGFSSKFWCIIVVCAHIEGACENALMVKLIWGFTGYTSVTNLSMKIKFLLQGTCYPDQLSNHARVFDSSSSNCTYCTCVTPFLLGNFHAFAGICWLFSKLFFSVGPDLGPNCLRRLSAEGISRR